MVGELERVRTRLERAAGIAGRYERALVRQLEPWVEPAELSPGQIRQDAELALARERFRAAHRRHMSLRDDCAGFEDDLARAGGG